MNIKCVVTGYLDENCYILSKNDTCLIVDPGDDFLKIKEAIGTDKVLGVLITHSHVDHIGALRNFLTKRSIKIFKRSNLEEKEYEIGDFKFKCFHTPGHSKDSVSFYFEENNAMLKQKVLEQKHKDKMSSLSKQQEQYQMFIPTFILDTSGGCPSILYHPQLLVDIKNLYDKVNLILDYLLQQARTAN